MDRWQRLRLLALEFEEYGRQVGCDDSAEQVRKLENALQHKVREHLELERNVDDERALFVQRLEREMLKVRTLEAEVVSLRQHLVAMRLGEDTNRAALVTACTRGDLATVRQLLEPPRLAHSRIADNERVVAEAYDEGLLAAAGADSVECCEFLLSLGADPETCDQESGMSVLHRAVAAPALSDKLLRHLLADDRVREHIDVLDTSGTTPLGLAVQLLRVEKIMCLMSYGADADLVPRDDWIRLDEYQKSQGQSQHNDVSLAAESTDTTGMLCTEAISLHPALEIKAPLSGTQGPTVKAPGDTVEQMSDRAELLYHQDELEEAMRVYSVLEVRTREVWSPENRAMLFYNMARTCYKLDRKAECVDWCDRVLVLFADYQDALSQRAEARIDLLDFMRAAADFEAVSRLDSDSEVHWMRLARRARSHHRRLEDLYGVLALSRTSSTGEIRKAYHEASRRWHPDKNRDSRDAGVRAEIMFKAVAHAHYILSDAHRRAQYDASFTYEGAADEDVVDDNNEHDEFENDTRGNDRPAWAQSGFAETEEDGFEYSSAEDDGEAENRRSFERSEGVSGCSGPSSGQSSHSSDGLSPRFENTSARYSQDRPVVVETSTGSASERERTGHASQQQQQHPFNWMRGSEV